MNNQKIFVRAVAMLLFCSFLFSLSSGVLAAGGEEPIEYALSVRMERKDHTINTLKINGNWYASADDLCDLAGIQYSINDAGILNIFRYNPFAILCSVDKDKYVAYKNTYYVLLNDVETAIGFHFFEYNDKLYANIFKTPNEISARIYDVFHNPSYQLSDIVLSSAGTFAVCGTLARVISPFISNKSIFGLLTGENEVSYYSDAFSNILLIDKVTEELREDLTDIDEWASCAEKTLEFLSEILDKDGKIAGFLETKGVSKDFLTRLSDFLKCDPYDTANLNNLFHDYEKSSNTENIDGMLKSAVYIYAVVNLEGSLMKTLDTSYQDSDNKNAKDALKNIKEIYFDTDGLVLDFSEEWIEDAIMEKLRSYILDDLGINDLILDFGVSILDKFMNISETSDAFIMTPIYSSIQLQLTEYYYDHLHDEEEDTLVALRNIALLYLKTTEAAIESFEFDSELEASAKEKLKAVDAEFSLLWNCREEEYNPDYDNQVVVDWLESHCSVSKTPSYLCEELFDYMNWLNDEWLNDGQEDPGGITAIELHNDIHSFLIENYAISDYTSFGKVYDTDDYYEKYIAMLDGDESELTRYPDVSYGHLSDFYSDERNSCQISVAFDDAELGNLTWNVKYISRAAGCEVVDNYGNTWELCIWQG